jgi:hypothetical protein
MRVVGANPAISTITRRSAAGPCDRPAPEARGRALLVVEAPRQRERPPHSVHHPSAPFVAHLLATRMQAPQTRERRRAEPKDAIAVYRSMTKPVPERRVFGARI